MVDNCGNWFYEPDTPEVEKCDMDRVAELIVTSGYEPETTLENVVVNVILFYEGELDDEGKEYYAVEDERPYPKNLFAINPEDVAAYVEDMGGFKEFDYYC